ALAGHTGPVTRVACCPRTRRAASAAMDGTIRLWDLDTQQLLHEFRGPTGFAGPTAAFSADGELLACGFSDWSITIYKTDSGHPLHAPEARMPLSTRFTEAEAKAAGGLIRRPCISLSFSPNGRRLASTAPKCPVQLWDVRSGQETMVLPHDSPS